MTGAGGYGSNRAARALARRLPFGDALVRALYPPMPTLNVIATPRLQAIRAALFKPGALVINVGAGGAMGSGRRLWRDVAATGARIIALDIGGGAGIDLVADATRLPLCDATVDAVVLQAVLEHVREPDAVIAECWRVLRPGGHVYIEMPFLQGFHADPDDFQRFTLEGLLWRTRRFEAVDCGVSVGPFSTLVWLLRDGLSSWTRQPLIHAGARFLAGWVFAPLRYLDYLVRDNPVAVRLASEFFLLGRKPV